MDSAPAYKCHLLVPLWGQDYIDLFLNVSLPTQLAPGNLPALARRALWSYHILTDPADAPAIEASPAFLALAALGPARVIPLAGVDFRNADHYQPFSACYRAGMGLAAREGAACIFLTADQLWSDGALGQVVELGRAGAEAVLGSGPRLLQETFRDFFAKTYGSQPTNPVSFSSAQGVDWALQFLHPWDRSLFWAEGGWGRRASFLYWGVADEGFLMRCLHLHPILLNPRQGYTSFNHTIDGGDLVARACPGFDRIKVIVDSDQAFFCSLAPAAQSAQWIAEPKVDWLGLSRWALGTGITRHNLFYLGHVLRFHRGACSDEAWARAEQCSAQVVRRVQDYLDHPLQLALFGWLARLRRPMGSFLRRHPALYWLYHRMRPPI